MHTYTVTVNVIRHITKLLIKNNLIFSEWKFNIIKNLQLCHAAITRQAAFCQVLQKTIVPETSYMFLLERNLMHMATSGLAAGCVYVLVFRHESNYNVRYFESGIFAGFF